MEEYAEEICQFLAAGPCPAPRDRSGESEPTSFLSVNIAGRAQPRLTDPAGLLTGIDLLTGDLLLEIPDSAVEVIAGNAGLTVPDPMNGEYLLEIAALPEEVFQVEVAYLGADGTHTVRASGIYHDVVLDFAIDLDSNADPVIFLNEPLGRPVNVRSEVSAGLTQLAWDPADDPLVIGYNVYARPDNQPKFALLGTTTETSFDSGHPWNVAGSAPTWHYFVVSVGDSGTESFVTEMVENRHWLVARFSAAAVGAGQPTDPETIGDAPVTVAFTDESSGEAFAWAWDFDGDGAIDSTEQDPQYEYTLPGSYTVTLTVGGPEGTDTTERPGAVVVGPLPEPNRPGDFNGDGVVDLLDYAAFSERMSGPFVGPTLAGWHIFDLDYDYDVDLDDLHLWVQLLVGSSPADPG